MSQNEGKIKQDVDQATQTMEQAFSRALHSAYGLGFKIGQLLESIMKIKNQTASGVSGKLSALTEGLDKRTKSIHEKNNKLTTDNQEYAEKMKSRRDERLKIFSSPAKPLRTPAPIENPAEMETEKKQEKKQFRK